MKNIVWHEQCRAYTLQSDEDFICILKVNLVCRSHNSIHRLRFSLRFDIDVALPYRHIDRFPSACCDFCQKKLYPRHEFVFFMIFVPILFVHNNLKSFILCKEEMRKRVEKKYAPTTSYGKTKNKNYGTKHIGTKKIEIKLFLMEVRKRLTNFFDIYVHLCGRNDRETDRNKMSDETRAHDKWQWK